MEKVKAFINSFKEFFLTISVYDFAFLGGFFLLFLLFFLLAVLFRKNIALFILFFIISLSIIGAAPFVVNSLIDEYINKYEVVYKNNRQLNFFDGILISGSLINEGRVDFKRCVFDVTLFMPASNAIKESANKLKPLLKREFVLEGPIKKGEAKDFRYLIEGISFQNYEKEVDIRCF